MARHIALLFAIVPCLGAAKPEECGAGACKAEDSDGFSTLQTNSRTAPRIMKLVQGSANSPGFESDWDSIADHLQENSEFWKVPAGTKGPDGKPITEDLAPYANLAITTFKVVSEIDKAGKGGEDWGTAIYNIGNDMLPLISMANPVAGMAAAIFLSFFGSSSDAISEALKRLYKRIMSEVKDMINEAFCQFEWQEATNTMSTIAKTWHESPEMLWNSTGNPELRAKQVGFFQTQIGAFNRAMPIVFGQSCVKNLKPATPVTEKCSGYQRKGALTFQYIFAIQHLNVYIQNGALASQEEQHIHLDSLKRTANLYYDLLKASNDNWLTYGEKHIPRCKMESYDSHLKSCKHGRGIFEGYVRLAADAIHDGNTGQNIPETQKCRTHSSHRVCMMGGDRCYPKDVDGMCDTRDYQNYKDNWRFWVNSFKPLIAHLTHIYA